MVRAPQALPEWEDLGFLPPLICICTVLHSQTPDITSSEQFKESDRVFHAGLWNESNEEAQVAVPAQLNSTLQDMGLDKAMGYLWMVPQNACRNCTNSTSSAGDVYVPYKVSLGLPLYNSTLCKMVRFRLCTDHVCPLPVLSVHCCCRSVKSCARHSCSRRKALNNKVPARSSRCIRWLL